MDRIRGTRPRDGGRPDRTARRPGILDVGEQRQQRRCHPRLPVAAATFELLVEPHRFSREAATANLSIASRLDRATSVGGVSASLDNPLTNLNLTEGTTITPSQVGGSDAWIVSSAESDHRTVVWSPDDTTWVAVN